jgi:uncharacterized protein (TIGR02646 family)
MKACIKLEEPPTLVNYRVSCPNSTWKEMYDDPQNGGMLAYRELKRQLVKGQRCLCAYCEISIAGGTSAEQLDAGKCHQRVEHFHPKDDRTQPPNWALHWANLWAVCHGGSNWPPDGEALDPATQLPPLKENLSCDAFKDQQIRSGTLNNPPEGWILSPHQVPPFPRLIAFESDGTPIPDAANCENTPVNGNRHPDTVSLVAATIRHLNLGCTRLKRNRSIVRGRLEKRIAALRQQNPGRAASEVLLQLARTMFSDDPSTPWLAYFTFVRWRLDIAAEQRLKEIGYKG